MFALWSTALASEVEAALAAGDGGPRGLMARLGGAQALFDDADAFANLNTPQISPLRKRGSAERHARIPAALDVAAPTL